jgi:hypothetical protein
MGCEDSLDYPNRIYAMFFLQSSHYRFWHRVRPCGLHMVPPFVCLLIRLAQQIRQVRLCIIVNTVETPWINKLIGYTYNIMLRMMAACCYFQNSEAVAAGDWKPSIQFIRIQEPLGGVRWPHLSDSTEAQRPLHARKSVIVVWRCFGHLIEFLCTLNEQ